MRRSTTRMVGLVLAVVLVVAVVATGVVLLVNPGGSSGPAAAKAAVSRALAAAKRAGSFHYVSESSGANVNQTIVGDAGVATGHQYITLGKGQGHFTLVLVGRTVYFKGDAAAVSSQLGVTAASAGSVAGRWVAVTAGDAPYSTLEPGITVASALSQIAFTARRVSSATLDGHAVKRIDGSVPSTPGTNASATAALYVDQATGLPLRFEEQVTSGTTHQGFTITFSHWREHVAETAPSGAVPYSSLPTTGRAPSGGAPVPSFSA